MLVIWGRDNSVNVQKALWVAEEIGLPYRRIDAGGAFGVVDTPEYRRLNPNGLVPTIDDDGFILWESGAIVRYLAAKHSPGTLWPTDLRVRAEADRWMDWKNTTFWPAIRPLFWNLIRTPVEQRDPKAMEDSRLATIEMLKRLEALGCDFVIAQAWQDRLVLRPPPGVDLLCERHRLAPRVLAEVDDRVLVSYKTIETGRTDPSGIPTSAWRDPGQMGLPENQLVGSYYTGRNAGLSFPLRVSGDMARDRIYRHTGLQTLPAGSVAAVGTQIVGPEWNSVTDSRLNPLGLAILAESPVAGALLTDAGDDDSARLGPAFAHMTRYVAPSGALVFAAGTAQWGWGPMPYPRGGKSVRGKPALPKRPGKCRFSKPRIGRPLIGRVLI